MTDLDRWSTDDLLALRADVAKYDDSEARDDHGRWTSGGADGGVDLQAAGTLWTNDGYELMREELARSVPNMEGGAIRRDAVGLLNAVAKAGPSPVPLYRGLSSGDGSLKDEFAPGKSIDLNLSSWSSSHATARDFASPGYHRDGPDTSFMLRLEPGARALNLTDTLNGQSLLGRGMDEREWVTDGRYTVSAVDAAAGFTMVTLRQEGVFTAPDQALGSKAAHGDRDIPLADAAFHPAINAAMAERMVPRVRKYSADQPRDDHGRWASDGGSASQPGGYGNLHGLPWPTTRVEDRMSASGWEESLTDAQRAAVSTYKGGGYEGMNNVSRQGTGASFPGTARTCDLLDQALAKSTVPSDVKVYRGTSSEFWPSRSMVGASFTDKGFVSTSFDRDYAKSWAGTGARDNLVMTISVPAGTHGGYVPSGERELILPRDTTFDVTGDVTRGDARYITASVRR